MAEAIQLRITGDKELIRKLDRMTGSERARVSKLATAKGARPIQKEMKAQARKRIKKKTGSFAKAIQVKSIAYRHSGNAVAIVGAQDRLDPNTGMNPMKIAHLLEGGQRAHVIAIKTKRVMSDLNNKYARATGNFGNIYGIDVEHPGTSGYRIFENAAKAKFAEAERIIQRELKNFIEKEMVRSGVRF